MSKPQKAFWPQDLDARLEEGMRAFIREPRNVRIDRKGSEIYLSEIFKWFEEDFTGWYRRAKGVSEARITDYLMLYLPEEDRLFLKAHPDVQTQYTSYAFGNFGDYFHKADGRLARVAPTLF